MLLDGTARADRATTLRALLSAAHPGPAFGVTVMVGVLALAVGLEPVTALLVVAAVLTGQLSIGWSNDLIDLARDRAHRPQRQAARDRRRRARPGPRRLPACAGRHRRRCPWPSAGCPACVHLVSVAAGWAYNLRLKSTVWSWLPYAVAFGALPAVPSPALPGVDAPWWRPVGGALLGVGAHLLNVLPDLDDDAATGVARAAAPARPPRRRDRRRRAAVVLLLTASGLLLAAVPRGPGVWVTAVLVVGLAVRRPGRARGGRRSGRRWRSRWSTWSSAWPVTTGRAARASDRRASRGTSSSSAPARPARGGAGRAGRRPGAAGAAAGPGATSRATSPAATASRRTSSTRWPRSAPRDVVDGWDAAAAPRARPHGVAGPCAGPLAARRCGSIPRAGLRRPAGAAAPPGRRGAAPPPGPPGRTSATDGVVARRRACAPGRGRSRRRPLRRRGRAAAGRPARRRAPWPSVATRPPPPDRRGRQLIVYGDRRAAVVRLGLRPRRRPVQRRVRRAARRRHATGRPPALLLDELERLIPGRARARAASGAATTCRCRGWRWRPARRAGAAGRRRGRPGQPDDRRGHLLRRRHRASLAGRAAAAALGGRRPGGRRAGYRAPCARLLGTPPAAHLDRVAAGHGPRASSTPASVPPPATSACSTTWSRSGWARA